jgi:hypothetical protein
VPIRTSVKDRLVPMLRVLARERNADLALAV